MAFTRQTYFLPTQISNCSLWLDAADTSSDSLILSGSNISTWKDKSGTGNNATANTGTVTTNSTKINGLNTIRFNSSSFLNIASFTMTANISVFAVLRGVTAQETGPKGYFFLGTGAQPSFFVYTLPPANGNLAGPFSAWVATSGETNWYMPSSDFFLNNPGFIYTDNNSSFVNGSQLTFNPNRASVPNAVSAGAYSIQVGGRVQSDSLAFDFAECIFYNRTITVAQRQQVEAYLAQKWGLTGSLPAGHPGLTSLLFRLQQPFLAKKQYFTAFSPRQIPGCSLWLDAADSSTITIQTGVSQWNDKSGQGRHVTQSTTSLQPVYSSVSNALVFNSNAWLGIPNALAAITPTYTIFVVDKRASASVHFFIGMHTNTGANVALVLGYNGTTTSHHTTAHITDCIVTIPAYAGTSEPKRLARYDYTGSLRDTYINGGQLSTIQSFSATLPTWNNANVGAGYYIAGTSGLDWWYVGNIHEIIFYNNVLSIGQAQQVESYLAQKWGLVPSIPAGHLNTTFPAGSPTAIQPYVASVSPLNLKFIAYPTGTPTVNTPTNTTTTLNMTWNAPTFTTSWSARQITRVIITSYTVYVLADGSLAATLSPGNVLLTTYSPMTSGVAYSFYVRANGPAGQSASSAISSTVTYILPPGSPTVNTPTNTVSTLNMTWNAPVGGGQVTSYTVYVLAAGSLVSTLTPGFVTSTTFSPMTGDVAYSFYVTATGPGGTSSASSTSATVTYSAGPMSYLTGVNTYTGTTSTNWTNNWQPYLSAVFSCNAVSNITITFSKITITPAFTAGGWFLGAVHTNSNIYYPPYNATNGILCLNPNTGVTSLVGVNSGISYAGTAKWYTGCLGPDGNIYFFPTLKATILKYIPSTDTASEITIAGTGGTYASQGYRGAVLGSDGRIYSSPYGATSIFWYNPATNTSGNIASASSTANRYEGAAIGTNGNIYFSPLTAQLPILKLNLSTYATTTTITTGVSATNTYRGAASLAANGNLYFPPSSTNSPVISMTSAESVSLLSVTSATGYRDTFLGPDGNIYVIPAGNAINVVKVVTSDNSISVIANTQTPTTQFNSQGANMALDGNIYVSVNGANVILKIIFNNVRYPFDSNYILSPYASHH